MTIPPTASGAAHGDAGAADERNLLLAAASGDAAAATRLVVAYQARIRGLAFRLLGWSGEIDDVCQDVFLAALANARRFRGDASLATWLLRITLNECRRRRRAPRSSARLDADLGATAAHESRERERPVSAADTSNALHREEQNAQVRAAIERLPDPEREVIVLRYLEEMDIAAIADLLETSRAAIDTRLSRARDHLRDSLASLERP